MLDKLKKMAGLGPRDYLVELSGDLGLTYFPAREGHPAFISGMYGKKGVTIDLLNEKGYFDTWHPHSRIVVSLDSGRRESHIISKKGAFYSRRLMEVEMPNPRFSDNFVILSSNPRRAKNIFKKEIGDWVMNLNMPFAIDGNQIIFHQNKNIEDKKRFIHIVDALIYVANTYDNLSKN